MSKEFKVPELGENTESGTVAGILVSEGDTVSKDQAVVELETDKAAVEVPCDIEGTVEKIHVKKGDEVKVGQTLLTLADGKQGGSDENASQDVQKKKKAKQKEPKKKKDDTTEPKKNREKADEKTESEPAEKPPEHEKQDNTTGTTEKKDHPKKLEKKDVTSDDSAKDKDTEKAPAPAAPSIRRFARELGIDINNVPGSGPGDRISMEDVKTYARSRLGNAPADKPTLPDFSQWGEIERKPMSKIRKVTAERMARAWSIVPHATQFGKAEITEIEKLRHRFAKDAEKAGGHMSLTVILVKTLASALKAFPRFNASIDTQNEELVFKSYFNIGIAMDTERGLVVPVVRKVDGKNIVELSVEIKQLIDKARNGKLTVDDMQGGNITITNAGALGGDLFIPMVNWPEPAILGVAQTRTEPVFRNEEFTPGQMLPLALSYDHRVIDGADGVRFMRWIIEALENPVKAAWEW